MRCGGRRELDRASRLDNFEKSYEDFLDRQNAKQNASEKDGHEEITVGEIYTGEEKEVKESGRRGWKSEVISLRWRKW